ncbi:MAG: 6,7-dimethyl-8-ribityllumazine synthase [Betaproteobacteria bacterium]|nr:6,7-dimethyl-8-ribityllumazine synthase [Betaproteobacteria bacterium]
MNILETSCDGRGLRIGIVQSRFNESIVSKMTAACVVALEGCGVETDDIDLVTVPGALEIPHALRVLAATTDYDGLIAIGAVIRGDTYHFEIVANESCRGVMDVMLATGIPIANGILTTNTDVEAESRAEDKARDCAKVVIELVRLTETITPIYEAEE